MPSHVYGLVLLSHVYELEKTILYLITYLWTIYLSSWHSFGWYKIIVAYYTCDCLQCCIGL
jgi:hypothetical protein